MAGLIEKRHAVDVVRTASRRSGEFTVLVDGEVAIKKRLPFVKPGDEKVLAAVTRALA